ncbi:MAG: hypothetical protein NTU41_00815 [Chloroflexi bacterium]|nr:hypothetical protein [Chloroflexota bacterium]
MKPKASKQLVKRGTTFSPHVTLNIQPGRASPAQKHAWHTFWQRLIAEVEGEQQDRQSK